MYLCFILTSELAKGLKKKIKHKESMDFIIKLLLNNLRRSACVGMFMLSSLTVFSQRVALKTNALYWATASANIGLELRVSRHVTFDIDAIYHEFYWLYKIDTRAEILTPEVRYWFSARPQAHHYIGIMGLAANYKFILKNFDHHIGDAYGVGLTYGYSFPLSRHWSLETSVGAGLGYRREKNYDSRFDPEPERNNYNKWQFMPMKAGVSFVYIIK